MHDTWEKQRECNNDPHCLKTRFNFAQFPKSVETKIYQCKLATLQFTRSRYQRNSNVL